MVMIGGRSIVMSVPVCVRVSVRDHIVGTTRPIFASFCACYLCRGSVLLWRRGCCQSTGQTDGRTLVRFVDPAPHNTRCQCQSDMELGDWVIGSMGHFGHLSCPGHRVIILTRCEIRVFPVF